MPTLEPMKTIREWLETLPDGIRERAIKNAWHEEWNTLGECAYSLSQALGNAFIWDDTEEKDAFWRDVHSKAMGHRDNWPPIPPLSSNASTGSRLFIRLGQQSI